MSFLDHYLFLKLSESQSEKMLINDNTPVNRKETGDPNIVFVIGPSRTVERSVLQNI